MNILYMRIESFIDTFTRFMFAAESAEHHFSPFFPSTHRDNFTP